MSPKAAELQQLQASERQYRALFDSNPLPIWVTDCHSHAILDVNLAAVARYGYSRAEFLAMHLHDVQAEALDQNDPIHALPRRHRKKDGQEIDVEVSTDTLLFNGHCARLVLAHDVSQHVRTEKDLARLSRAHSMVTACNEALVRASSELTLLQEICRIAVDIGGYRMAWVGFALNDGEKMIDIVAHAGAIAEHFTVWPMSWSADSPYGQGPAGRAIRSGEMVVVPDIRQEAIFSSWLKEPWVHNLRGVASLPLRNTERTFGLFYLYANDTIDIVSETPLLLQLAGDLAFGIDHLRNQESRRQSDAHIRHQAALLDKAQDAIVVRGMDQRVLYANKRAEALYGWTADEVVGHVLLGQVYRDPQAMAAAHKTVLETGEWRSEMPIYRKDNSKVEVEVRWTLITDADNQPHSILSISTDISQRKATEREIQKLAFYDPLTQLPNRQLLIDRLQHALETSMRNGQGGALLFIDLDHFKTLNDTLGHDKGDMLLQHVAQRISHCVRTMDTVARLGGDEFVVMLEDLGDNPQSVAEQARRVGEKILLTLGQPYQLDGHEHQSTASIGIAPFSNQANTVGELLKQADIAMYQAKAAGRNTVGFFDPQLQAAVTEKASLEADLRMALAQGMLFLHYQTQHNAEAAMTGVEALVRWKHPQRGMVSPAVFIPLAEETGLILELGRQVLLQACTQLASWQHQDSTRQLTMAVNVSSRQFKHPGFVQQVMDTLAHTTALPALLKLELTESLLVDDIEQVITKMEALQAHGVGFSLDDFGTGYSSLSYLKRLPLDLLKIDQSFVRDVMTDPNDATIARTIIGLGQSLGLNVIAEGVETDAQRNFLAEHGCQAYQGYLFGRPMPADQLAQLIQTLAAG
ncbi:EAL domain-containing protein [Rhodoferax sp.]|uniref:sensor domain-containing protein n=1 Tax=Rhodoferax sp. TaxID=50421 RepID=UPI00374DCA84